LAATDFVLLSDSTFGATSFSQTAGLTAGQRYRYAVKAVNAAGIGNASSLISILAASVPSAPNPPTVTFQNEQTISIAWNLPTDNGSDVLQGYTVYWDQGLGTGTYVALASTDAFTLTLV
jgi:hypothetical protein